MKFEYDTEEKDRECVAFMRGGDLYIKERNDGNLVISPSGSYKGIQTWGKVMVEIDHKFYKGDKITITF